MLSLSTIVSAILIPMALGFQETFSNVRDVLVTAISNNVTPGLVAGIRDSFGTIVFYEAFGSLTYGENTPLGQLNSNVSIDTLYDMASISKLIGPVTCAAYLYQIGAMPDLDEKVSSSLLLGTNYSQNGKENITLRNLLLHNSGYPPDPNPSYASTLFACPATSIPSPPLTLSCQDQVYVNLMAQVLENPIGSKMVYSDLSMITLLFIIGRVVTREGYITNLDFDLDRLPECINASIPTGGLYYSCAYEAYWRLKIKPKLFLNGNNAQTTYLLDHSLWPYASPTYIDQTYRHRIMQGDVSDANSYALGGIAGHAGIFSTLGECLNFTSIWQYGSETSLLNQTTTSLWTTVYNETFSSRALGWVTQASTDTYFGCGNMSASTFYHTGYTGTLVCVDTLRNISTVLLTTRVYPDEGNVPQIQALRQSFNNAVIAELDKKKIENRLIKEE
jgi:serine-type D-Ala-D-Ala carboxypeptidase